ncbi:uncharacterized protein LOC5502964 isoform X2 [Nematostella vectensis]|nr:uncharacterized protein LOC5502964 isoform X2 [Nematostella vectensis]
MARPSPSKCYCDDLCSSLGDCCYDYIPRCENATEWRKLGPGTRTCVDGVIAISRCPSLTIASKAVISGCHSASSQPENLLSGAPVYDYAQGVSYRNLDCALCNNATNVTFWYLKVACPKSVSTALGNMTALLIDVRDKCTWEYQVKNDMKKLTCQSPDDTCKRGLSGDSVIDRYQAIVHDLCHMYALPMYPTLMLHVGRGLQIFKPIRNPHCLVCLNITSPHTCREFFPNKGSLSPDLGILFSLSPGRQPQISVTERHSTTKGTFIRDADTTSMPMMPSGNYSTLHALNCTLLVINKADYKSLENSSVFVPSLSRIYPNNSYFIVNESLFVCSSEEKGGMAHSKVLVPTGISVLQIITYVGLAVSFVSEVLLLAVYAAMKQLRNVPGLNLMSFVTALIMYQVIYQTIGLDVKEEICIVIATTLHYFLLAAFAWTGIMAYDTKKTFSTESIRHGYSAGRFLRYCVTAWGGPLIFVLTCVTLDRAVPMVTVGYGSGGYCWIGSSLGLAITFHVPIALFLVFNLVCFTHTLVSIRRTMKNTRVVRTKRTSSLLTLCVKLSSVMGFTWGLGLIVGFVHSPYLLYPYVILNSFQGFFVSLVYLSNTTTIKHIKSSYKRRGPITTQSVEKLVSLELRQTRDHSTLVPQ